MKLKLKHKRAWGNDRYYPACPNSRKLLEIFKQSCLTLEQARELKNIGVEIIEEKEEGNLID